MDYKQFQFINYANNVMNNVTTTNLNIFSNNKAPIIFLSLVIFLQKNLISNNELEEIQKLHFGNRQIKLKLICLNIDVNPYKLLKQIKFNKDNDIIAYISIADKYNQNLLSMLSKHFKKFLISYILENDYLNLRIDKVLHLQIDTSYILLIKDFIRHLNIYEFKEVAFIIDHSENSDKKIFEKLFNLKIINQDLLNIKISYIYLFYKSTLDNLKFQLQVLKETSSRIFFLICSTHLAKIIINFAEENNLFKGYAWFLNKNIIHREDNTSFPSGLYSINRIQSSNYSTIFDNLIHITINTLLQFIKNSSVLCNKKYVEKLKINQNCSLIYEKFKLDSSIKNTVISGLSKDNYYLTENGLKYFEILILDSYKNNSKHWRIIRNMDTNIYNTIFWPEKLFLMTKNNPEKVLRVVTVVAEPFVLEQPEMGNCLTSIPCLRINSKNKAVIDKIFIDFKHSHHSKLNPYNVSCCNGLSIMLLDRLARDLNFKIEMYITNDDSFGHKNINGNWTGLVYDLSNNLADIAISAFSVTSSRSQKIDFTYPFFYSGYSILVSERKKSPPMYAFMEPFDGWVWISIVVSATIVAVALSLLEWNSPFGLNPWGRKRKSNYTLGSGLNMVFAILFQHTIKTKSPKAWPSKWLQNFWAGASIFIYSSYTANLAAFLAGKNSGVIISGLDDPRLLDKETRVALVKGTAVEDFIRKTNPRLLIKAKKISSKHSINSALSLLINGKIDAYFDDTPILEYARNTMDSKCQLKLVGQGIGEDSYAIGLPKNSLLKYSISKKILEYHECGFTEDLKDMFFGRNLRCYSDYLGDGQLQGQAAPMNFDQHAGLYMLLFAGAVVCVCLILFEHTTFKWLVPYWRQKPTNSFWKSPSMMFWSQRLHRIITSEQLVSPHHSAREMIEVVKNRDFAKLFQKSVRKQEIRARNRKNIFNIVEQLKWKNRSIEEKLNIFNIN